MAVLVYTSKYFAIPELGKWFELDASGSNRFHINCHPVYSLGKCRDTDAGVHVASDGHRPCSRDSRRGDLHCQRIGTFSESSRASFRRGKPCFNVDRSAVDLACVDGASRCHRWRQPIKQRIALDISVHPRGHLERAMDGWFWTGLANYFSNVGSSGAVFLGSWLIEFQIIARLTKLNNREVRRVSLFANATTYALMGLYVLIQFNAWANGVSEMPPLFRYLFDWVNLGGFF